MNKAGEIKVRAERRIGELLKAVPRERSKGAGRPQKSRPSLGADNEDREPTALQSACDQAAITARMAEDCQKLAAIPEPRFGTTIQQTGPKAEQAGP